jgi:hypothetical protein
MAGGRVMRPSSVRWAARLATARPTAKCQPGVRGVCALGRVALVQGCASVSSLLTLRTVGTLAPSFKILAAVNWRSAVRIAACQTGRIGLRALLHAVLAACRCAPAPLRRCHTMAGTRARRCMRCVSATRLRVQCTARNPSGQNGPLARRNAVVASKLVHALLTAKRPMVALRAPARTNRCPATRRRAPSIASWVSGRMARAR